LEESLEQLQQRINVASSKMIIERYLVFI